MCMKVAPVKDHTLQNRQVEIAKKNEANYNEVYMPVERELVDMAMDKNFASDSASTAYDNAGKTYDASTGNVGIGLSRFGMALTPAQQQAQQDKQAMGRNTATMAAGSNARGSAKALQGGLRNNMMAMGQGVQAQGLSSLTHAANMESARNQANTNAAAQQTSQNYQTAGTVASMAMMMSERKKKQNITPRSDDQDMADVREHVNYDYDYKPGLSGGRREKGHTGPMLEEVPEHLVQGDAVKVSGHDDGDIQSLGIGALRNIDKRLQKIESRQHRRQK